MFVRTKRGKRLRQVNMAADSIRVKFSQKRNSLFPVWGQHLLRLVVTCEPVDPALHQNQAELRVFVLWIKYRYSTVTKIITARKRSLGQGSMFTGVCLSTGGCLLRGGAWWRPPRRLLLQAVRILMECILVAIVRLNTKRLHWKVKRPLANR